MMVLAPMPRASEETATAVKPRLWRSIRDGVTEVGAKLVEQTDAERGADVLFVGFDSAELDARDGGLRRGVAGALEVFGAEFDVSVEFELDVGLEGVATEKEVEVGAELGPHG
jgi:hypothetical protein